VTVCCVKVEAIGTETVLSLRWTIDRPDIQTSQSTGVTPCSKQSQETRPCEQRKAIYIRKKGAEVAPRLYVCCSGDRLRIWKRCWKTKMIVDSSFVSVV
jgi:hypothetical protein